MSKYVPKPGSMSFSKLRQMIKNGEGIGTTKAERMISDAEKAGVIEKAINGKYVLIDKPITKTSELPFEKSSEDVPY